MTYYQTGSVVIQRGRGVMLPDGQLSSVKFTSEKLSWPNYVKECRGVSAISYGRKRVPWYFWASQFREGVPPETAAWIANKTERGIAP